MLRFCGFWFGLALAAQSSGPFVGATVCGKCHPSQFESQSKSGHAHALSRASAHPLRRAWPLATTEARRAGRFRYRFDGLSLRVDDGVDVLAVPMEWAFGAGHQAVTFVSRGDSRFYLEHYLSYFSKLKAFAPTPGQAGLQPSNLAEAAGLLYKIGDPVAGIDGCFECHSTGGLKDLTPAENGVRCEACHGPGAKHAESGGKAPVLNPRRMTASALNDACGRCHRPPASDPAKVDWNYAWNVRHQPVYLSQSACFVKSAGKLSCLTCHAPHEPLATSYDQKCVNCHATRAADCGPRDCAGCHMPRVSPEPPLSFTNHWIGIYRGGSGLRPAPPRPPRNVTVPQRYRAATVRERSSPIAQIP